MAFGFDGNKGKVQVEERVLLHTFYRNPAFVGYKQSVPNLNQYDYVEIELTTGRVFKFIVSDNLDSDISNGGLMAIYLVGDEDNLAYFMQRDVDIDPDENAITFGQCYCKLLSAATVTRTNEYLMPWKIYGIKS